MGRHRIDIPEGTRFGRWVVISYAGVLYGKAAFLCRCDCGTERAVSGHALRPGLSQSCGCLVREKLIIARTKHGLTKSHPVEFSAFINARSRCTGQNNPGWPDYGGRGIQFLFTNFDQFYAELGSKPSPELSLDRINNDGHYEPGNVRWATSLEQRHSQRRRGWTLFPRPYELRKLRREILGIEYGT